MYAILYFLGVCVIPFNGVKGVGALGELSHELSVYVFMPLIGLAVASFFLSPRQGATKGNGSPIFHIFGAMLVALALTFVVNISDIATSYFHDRSGFAKFAVSIMVVFYGMGLCWVTYRLVPGRWQHLIILPVAISVILCLGYSAFELLNQRGILAGVYTKINHIVHANSNNLIISWNGKVNLKVTEDWDTRIRSLCFEPPAFGNFSGFAWPWLLAGFMSNKGRMRIFYGALVVLFTGLIVIAAARTGWVLLTCNLFVLGALRFIYLAPKPFAYNPRLGRASVAATVTVLMAAAAYYMINFDHIVQKVISGDSVSNLSRLASQVAAIDMFKDRVLFGVGFGQYGFYVTDYMPEWGYLSYELRPWLIYPTAPWPAVYSMYARLAAEMGLVGVVGWISLWLFMSYKIVVKARQYLNLHGRLPVMAYPLVMSYFCILTSSITTDTLRTPMIWISLGLGCAFLNCLDLRPLEQREREG